MFQIFVSRGLCVVLRDMIFVTLATVQTMVVLSIEMKLCVCVRMQSNKTTKLSLSHDNILAHNISVPLSICGMNLLWKWSEFLHSNSNSTQHRLHTHRTRTAHLSKDWFAWNRNVLRVLFSVSSIIESSHSQLAKKHEETTRFMRANLIKWSLFVMKKEKKRKEKNTQEKESNGTTGKMKTN